MFKLELDLISKFRYGSDIVKLKGKYNLVPLERLRPITVHENLLCNSSLLFKSRLQATRKTDDRNCTLCDSELAPERHELDFCRVHCGKNFHLKCIEREKAKQAEAELPPCCPLCRESWPARSEEVFAFENIKMGALFVYTNWLYYGALETDLDALTDTAFIDALNASYVLRAEDFTHFLIANYVDKMTRGVRCPMSMEDMKYAHGLSVEVWRFARIVYLTYATTETWNHMVENCPCDQMKLDLRYEIEARYTNPTVNELLWKFTKGEYLLKPGVESEVCKVKECEY